MTTVEQLAIPSAMVALVFLVFAWIKFRAERSALPEWRRSFGLAGLSLATIACSLFVAGLCLGWIGGFGSHYVTLDIVDGECLMISLFSVVCVSFLKGFCRTLAVLAALLTLLL